ncbi:integrase [Pseudomonas putida]|nr:hypothetical protein [Pseudomonas putida]MDO1464130.1 integrase [Pseudomonas putida]
MKLHAQHVVDDWESWSWPGIRLKKLNSSKGPDLQEGELLDEGFLPFAKAYLVFMFLERRGPTFSQLGIMFRAVEAALCTLTGTGDVSKVSLAVLDEAALLLKANFSKESAYNASRLLATLASFLTDNFFVAIDLKTWQSPNGASAKNMRATGRKGDRARESKMPRKEALNALGEIFSSNLSSPRDIFTTSLVALLLCAPSRGNEILALTVDAEVEEADLSGNMQYGFRFYASKGAGPMIKWIPSSMVPLAKEAFSRLVKLSEPGRKLAEYLEGQPQGFYRHSACPKVMSNLWLSNVQAAQALGMVSDCNKQANGFLTIRGYSSANEAYTLDDLWGTVQQDDINFPWFDEAKGVKFSQCICTLLKYQLSSRVWTNPVVLARPALKTLADDLGGRSFQRHGTSIFERHGYKGAQGEKLKMSSHAVRHLLNTLAIRGGLSDFDLARWSGRLNVKSNRDYDHTTDEEVIERVRQLGLVSAAFPQAEVRPQYVPVDESDFPLRAMAAMHVTEYGFCSHSFSIEPCRKFRDCINCTEHVCIKGLASNYERILRRLDQLELVLEKTKDEQEPDDYGADRWIVHTEMTIDRLKELVSLMSNPKLVDGAVIRLKGNDFTQLSRVINRLDSEGIEGLNHGEAPEGL